MAGLESLFNPFGGNEESIKIKFEDLGFSRKRLDIDENELNDTFEKKKTAKKNPKKTFNPSKSAEMKNVDESYNLKATTHTRDPSDPQAVDKSKVQDYTNVSAKKTAKDQQKYSSS
jgi:hypothetical protein